MPRKRERRKRAEHDLRAKHCPACSEIQGEPLHCVKDYSQLDMNEQRRWYRKTGHCGRCGQRADTQRILCKCHGLCGCWELHKPVEQGIEGQAELF